MPSRGWRGSSGASGRPSSRSSHRRRRVQLRHLVRQRRARFAREFEGAGFLVEAVADRLLDRLGDIRNELRRILVLGGSRGLLETALSRRPGCEFVLASDADAGLLPPAGTLAA